MSTYANVEEARRFESLPENSNVGPCQTCRYWSVEGAERTQGAENRIARCMQPQLRSYALLVTACSGCNRWAGVQNDHLENRQMAGAGHAY